MSNCYRNPISRRGSKANDYTNTPSLPVRTGLDLYAGPYCLCRVKLSWYVVPIAVLIDADLE